jgi:glycosyltransferase domain-containing protein
MTEANLFTVVVPTYNRPAELARLLNFQKELGCQSLHIVVDGSEEGAEESNRRICAQFANVEYHKFPSTLHLGLRLTEGLRLVRTPYVLICADDDFYFPSGAAECALFLQAHAGYAAAIGTVWSMRYFSRLPLVRGGVALGNDLSHGNDFNHGRFIQRTLHYFAYTGIGSIPLFYSLRRTDQTLKAFSAVTAAMKYSSMEVLTNCMLLIDGQVAKLPVAFGLRDYASVTTRDLERDDTVSYIPRVDLDYMRPILVDALAKAESLSLEMATYLIDSVLRLWSDDGVKLPVRAESQMALNLRRVGYCLECLAGRIAAGPVAAALNLDAKIYSVLLRVHRRHTARRSISG